MAHPAATPPSTADRPLPTRRRLARRRPNRLVGALVGALVGLAVLGAGFARTTGGLAEQPVPRGSGGPGSSAGAALGSAGIQPTNDPSPREPTPASSGQVPDPSAAPERGASAGPTAAERRQAILGVRLQAELDRVRAKLAIPGASVTILMPDGTAWNGASGLADIARLTPVTPATAFAYASISKTFTSALILQLAADGLLSLQDPAADRLPPLRISIDRRITVAMLLDHTSGLADYFLNPKIDGPLQRGPETAWTTDRTLAYVGRRLAPPGKAWHYSNTNYLLLGLIAERQTGQTLATAIRTRLLDPTGLAATWYQVSEAARTPLAHGYRLRGTKLTAKAIDVSGGGQIAPFRSVVTATAGAGSLAGTSGDIARWSRALYSGKVLGPLGTAALLSAFRPTTAYQPGVVYGYGVQAVSIDGHPSLGHSGRLLGFRGVVRHFPIEGLTIAVLTNQSRADPGEVLRALLAVALPTAPNCLGCSRAA